MANGRGARQDMLRFGSKCEVTDRRAAGAAAEVLSISNSGDAVKTAAAPALSRRPRTN